MSPKTSEEVLAELTKALEEARELTKEIHIAKKDFKQAIKIERERRENIYREEVARAIGKVYDDLKGYLLASGDEVIAEFRKRLFQE